MGVVFLAYASLPSGAVYAFAWFNFFMHTYIVVFIGISNGIHTFIPWNAMCVALSALLFGQEQLGEVSAASHLQPHHFILLILLHAPPILQLFGKNEFGTLSHSWFVPSASGCCFLFVPSPFSTNIPSSENGMPIMRLRDARLRSDAAAHLSCVTIDGEALFGAKADIVRWRQLVQECSLIDGDWVIALVSSLLYQLMLVIRLTSASAFA